MFQLCYPSPDHIKTKSKSTKKSHKTSKHSSKKKRHDSDQDSESDSSNDDDNNKQDSPTPVSKKHTDDKATKHKDAKKK